ncbi:MAG: hypothetical protein IJ228_11045 [Succinivibrio sp.]|nr:hypothetical protein [Succinivibrio sp.]
MPVSARARPELQPHDIMLRFAPFPGDFKHSFSGLSDLVGKTPEDISLAAFRRLTSEIGERRATLFVYRKPSWLFTWSHFGRLEEVPLDDMPDEQLMSAGEIVCRCFMKKLENAARHHGVLSDNYYKNAWDFFDARDLWAKWMQELKACGSSLVPCFERERL